MEALVQSLMATKVNQIPAWAGKNANKATVMNVYAKFAKNYNAKYMRTGSFMPIVHGMFLFGGLGYMMEFSHLVHERQSKYH